MRTEKGDFNFTVTPRWAVIIADSELHTCPRCGTQEGTVVRASALERKIATEVLAKDSPLAPDEELAVSWSSLSTGRNAR